MLAALLAMPLASAQSASDLSFSTSQLVGEQGLVGNLVGLRLAQDQAVLGGLTGFSPLLRLQTTNSTATAYAYTAPLPTPGGVDEEHRDARIAAASSQTQVDLLIVPVAGAPAPTVSIASSSQFAQRPASSELRETAYVDSARPTLAADVSQAIQVQAAAHRVRVEGTFQVSVWSWNFTLDDRPVPTGSIRTDARHDPVLGRELAAQTMEQVAVLTFHGGWLEVDASATVSAFSDDARVDGTGRVTLTGVDGPLSLSDATVVVDGSYRLRQALTDGTPFARFSDLEGTAQADGRPIDLPLGSEDARPGTAVARPADGRPSLAFGAWFAALLAVAVVLHGPMRSLRFRSIRRRFESRDYIAVLTRIDPFTRRRRYRRSANLLKAISLLSLGQFREASLFLRTLGPLDGPDPATQAFLRACAAAGQEQDADALQHLAECFRIDPTFREEARTVPALRGLLPYFDNEAGAA